MSDIGQAIFGGSKNSSSQSSSNQAYPLVKQQFAGQIANGTGANDALAGALGVGGNPQGAAQGLQDYKNSAGFQSTLDAGSHAITDNNAARGLLQSGATGQALTNYGQQQNQQFYNNYLGHLLGLGQQGLGAGSLEVGAGQQSQGSSSGSQKPGIGGFIGKLASSLPMG